MFAASANAQPSDTTPPPSTSSSPPKSTRPGAAGPDPKPSVLPPLATSPMERSAPEYSQTGLPSPYPSIFGDTRSEGSSADHAPSASSQYPVKQEVSYSNQATPTSEYSMSAYPNSARSTTFPEHLPRQYHPASAHASSSSSGDPSIAAPSPTYPYQHPPQSPYGHGPMPPQYPQSSAEPYPRPEWGAYPHGAPTYSQVPFPSTPASASGRPQVGQVYSFVPIPGSQQHKRPRRRYEEIERMYKCGWQGCEKAYGTLNHLNAHVTMQSHGPKRTPEEFKEIRKEWRARKKAQEEEDRSKEQQQRQAEAAAAAAAGTPNGDDAQPGHDDGSRVPGAPYRPVPPSVAYPTAQYASPTGTVPQQPMDYPSNPMYPNYPPSAGYPPYANGSQPPGH